MLRKWRERREAAERWRRVLGEMEQVQADIDSRPECITCGRAMGATTIDGKPAWECPEECSIYEGGVHWHHDEATRTLRYTSRWIAVFVGLVGGR